ncbi:hypothetical protein FJY90_03405 [Candidatus Gottesmanbacteria bacterium]|nr:hypothetical protein [Candidatus Gottesmanbacteria bacterium]
MATKNSNDKKLHLAIVKQMVTLATSGFGLVAALAWNSVIQEFVNEYIKKYLEVGSGIISLFIYAVLITILAVTVTYQLGKLVEKLEK